VDDAGANTSIDVGAVRAHQVAADFLAAIVASSEDAIYSKDREALITSWNRAAQRLYGYAADEVLGRPVSILIPEDKKGEEFDILHRILDGQRVEHYETRRQRKDGSIVEVSISVSPVHDVDGEIVEAAVIGRNITEQKRLERELRRLQEEQAHAAERQLLDQGGERRQIEPGDLIRDKPADV
jgi:PAS domain S-box-containing protein